MEATLIDKTAPPPMVGSVLHLVGCVLHLVGSVLHLAGSVLHMIGLGLWSHERDILRVAELGTSRDIAIFMR